MNYSSMPPEGNRYAVKVERIGNVKYTYYNDGVMRITKYRKRHIYWGRIAVAAIMLVLLVFALVQLGRYIAGRKNGSVTARANSFVFESSEPDVAAAVKETTENTAPAESAEESKDSTVSAAEPETRELKVCIDPGHGDIDFGNSDGVDCFEKDQNLEIALLVKDCLEAKGVTVIMTRENDSNISRTERCTLANTSGADLFVSLHRGGEDSVYFYGTPGVIAWVNSLQPRFDTILAQNILNALDAAGVAEDHGVYYGYDGSPDSNYEINNNTVMPSCQIELGCMLDSGDNQLFETNKAAYAQAIADGIIKTGVDLGVIGEDGTRKLGEQLLSDGKTNVTVNSGDDQEQ